MPPAAIIAGGAAAGLLGGLGNKKQQQRQNVYSQQASGMFNPQNMQGMMQGYNPMLMAALQGRASGGGGMYGGGYYQNLYNMAQNPGYMDPRLMNMPLAQSAQRGQQDLIAAQGKIGRSGMQGGLSNAYALANQAAQTQRDTGIMQQYALQREMQRRQDMQWLANMYQQNLGGALQGAGGAAGLWAQQQAPQTWGQTLGGMIGGGLGAYGAMG